jgi:uncharacterized protein involved in exopolysaccharide biosynthesis
MPDRESDLRAVPNLVGPPAGYFVVVPPADDEDEKDAINLAKVAALLRANWKLLLCLTLIGGAIAAGIALLMRNVYRAQAIVAPTSENQGGTGSSLANEFGGIAALAGIEVGAGGGRKAEAMGTLLSPGFMRDFILKYDLMPILFEESWDANAKTWRKGTTPPTLERGIKRFKGRRTIDENIKSGLVTMSFDWYSPELAALWTNDMIAMVNERMRARDILTAEKSLEYLNQEMATANAVELRQAISKLMETQVNNEMVANVQREYAYHFIDAAVPPQTKSGPWRSLIAAAGAIFGLTLGVTIVLVRRRGSSQASSP